MNTLVQDFLMTLFRRKKQALAFLFFMVSIPVTLSYVWPKKYKASATIYLKPGSYKKPFLPTEKNSTTSFMDVSMQDVASEAEVITCRPIMEQVVDANGLDKDVPPDSDEWLKYLAYHGLKTFNAVLVGVGLKAPMSARENAIVRLSEKVDVEFVKRTNIITIEWQGSSPELAQNVVSGIVDAYLNYHIKIHSNSKALETVKREMDLSYEKLKNSESKLDSYKYEHHISDVTLQRSQVLEKLNQLRKKIDTYDSLKENSADTSYWSGVEGDKTFINLREKLTDLELQLIESKRKFGNSDKAVKSNEVAIEQIKKLISDRAEIIVESSRLVEGVLRKKIESLDVVESRINAYQREIAGLNDVYVLNRKKFNDLAIKNSMEEAKITAARVVQYASLPEIPSFPKPFMILLVCSFLGTIGGVSYALVYDRLINRVTDAKELESIQGNNVCAVIPSYDIVDNKDKLRAAVMWDFLPFRRYFDENEGSVVALFLSASSQAGSNFISSHLADFLSNSSEQTLHVSFLFPDEKSSNGVGLKEIDRVIRNGDDIKEHITLDVETGVYSLVVEIMYKEIVQQNIWKSMIDLLRTHYKFIVIDISSKRSKTFTSSLTPFVDHTFLVVRYNNTNRSTLRNIVKRLSESNSNFSGCILNRYCNELPRLLSYGIFKFK